MCINSNVSEKKSYLQFASFFRVLWQRCTIMSWDVNRLGGGECVQGWGWIVYRLDSVQFLIFFGTQASGPCTSLIIITLSMTSPPCKKTKYSTLPFMDMITSQYQSKALLDITMDFVTQAGHLHKENSGDFFSLYKWLWSRDYQGKRVNPPYCWFSVPRHTK